MRRFAGRLVRSSWRYYNGPTGPAPPYLVRNLSGVSGIFIRPGAGVEESVTSHRLRNRYKLQLTRNVHNKDDEGQGPRIPAWLDPGNWLAKEDQKVIYGDDRDLENLPPEPKKREFWMEAQYPTGNVMPEKKKRKEIFPRPHGPQPKKSPKEARKEPPKPRNYLSKHPINSTQVYKRLFRKPSKKFHDFMREARVERQWTVGKLMVDSPEVRDYHKYWLELLRFRARIHGEKGVKDIWKGLSMRQADIPVNGPIADEMWRFFVKVGLEDEDFLIKLYKYQRQRFHQEGLQYKNAWSPMYGLVVGGLLSKKKPYRALWWHMHLVDMVPLSRLPGFFLDQAKDPNNIPILFKIFSSKRITGVYDTVVPFLCRQEFYEEAIRWHKMLLAKGDLPGSIHYFDRLMEYYAFHKPLKDVELALREFHERGIKIAQSTAIALIKARYRTREIMDLLCHLYNAKIISNDCFRDQFWAFLLTYQRFSEANVTEYMSKLGIDRIAHETTKEFVKRGKTTADFIRGLSLLNRRKIGVDNKVYTKFLEVKARWHPEEALQESLPIENLEISRGNALLQGYLSTYRWKFFNHVYIKLRMKNRVTWNLFLKRLLMTGQLRSALELMEEMRMSSIPIGITGQRELLNAILVPRRLGLWPVSQDRRAHNTKDLRIATNYLRAMLMNGEQVHPKLWIEIIKRHGMYKRLQALEKLCLWLVDWYDPKTTAFRKANTPIKFTDVRRIASMGYKEPSHAEWTDPPAAESNRSPMNPLRIIFPATTIRSLVEWGFISMKKEWVLDLQRRKAGVLHKSRLSRIAWGIRLVKKLQEKGVWVDKRSVARAVRVRLRALEGSKYQWESFDTNMSKHEPVNLGMMAAIAEKAWGEELFPKGSWDTDEGLMRMLKAPVKDIVLPRRLRRYR